MLCRYTLAFKAGEEALAGVGWGTWAELGECGRTRTLILKKEREYFTFSEEKAQALLLPTQWNTSLSPGHLLFAFLSKKAENWHWSFCHSSCPIATTGSSSHALTANTCHISTDPCKPATPVRAVGQGATAKTGPWDTESRRGCWCYKTTIPSCLGSW